MARAGRPPQDPARQAERAHRILDAAAELILRWGYDKTTVDDVAKRAGVAKGTIYLHWKTRDELFAALLRRERVLMLEGVRDSAPAALGELFGSLASALLRRPLLHAVLLDDSEVLGKLTRLKRRGPAGGLELGGSFDAYLRELVGLGAVREEPSEHVTVIGSIFYGFMFLPGALPESDRLPDDRVAALLAETVERAVGTGRALPPAAAGAVARATLDLLDALADVARRKLATSLSPAKERVQ
ncbi:TetR/AcrR family transcriptional regulator [Nonomuraea spiralis]|uniref:TetR/AcrR family transcriptional regulator n=1 Tax=Nonomuraea spiralis TaxID=46182 RepID=A0ABV5IM18_9ACTN|nr:TetR/AcrR family transcriptional regulator [Nonomuraea spiralis]GGT39266.1 TetR family transcriptional regulator [Nonomuraea spiralis]